VKEAVGQTTTTNAPMTIDPASQGPGVQTSGLSVSDAITRACGIPARPDGKSAAASFEFDSSALGQDDRDMLALVAKCMTDGALRGRRVTLIGRADPRGEEEYNMTLGGSRADAVHRYMVDLGVGRERMSATSRGELDATGKDETGWAKDRRVDIILAE
jgi:peptidoglycan-associated lipoprotein